MIEEVKKAAEKERQEKEEYDKARAQVPSGRTLAAARELAARLSKDKRTDISQILF